ncbi:MAG: isopentenyl-diphosphate Delta-isomerase [Eggerthellaceae bacterium]|nr:isopentenyl-diphosphate Delta-isomerase [Eggerthellaceae bacterium]
MTDFVDNMTNDAARNDELILVDGLDRQVGVASKERTHREGLLHRAFSVVLVRESASGPELLLAQRAMGKYHSSGMWANSCCSHPRAGEALMDAAYRRVREELGVKAKDLQELTAFVYRAPFENGLVEYEYDHVIVGQCVGESNPDPQEVASVRWIGVDDLAAQLANEPELFAPWAYTVFSLVIASLVG